MSLVNVLNGPPDPQKTLPDSLEEGKSFLNESRGIFEKLGSMKNVDLCRYRLDMMERSFAFYSNRPPPKVGMPSFQS